MGKIIGIDLGTTNSAFAYLVAGKPEVIANAEGNRIVSFELNGILREIVVKDKSVKSVVTQRIKADRDNPCQVAAVNCCFS